MEILEALTLDRAIALASSLGTLIAAALAVFSIREVRLQRSQQFQPRIVPTTASYELSVAADDLLDFEGAAEKVLPIFNVGHGVATDLSVAWEIDLDQWVTKVNGLSAQRGGGVGIKRDGFGLAFLHNGEHKGGARVPEDSATHAPYLVPVTADRTPTNAAIPGAIVALLNAYYWSYFRGLGSSEGVYRNPSPEFQIDLRISYKDTVGRTYVRRSVLAVSSLLKSDYSLDSKTMNVAFNIAPISNEPAEGYSTVTKIILEALKKSVGMAWLGVPSITIR